MKPVIKFLKDTIAGGLFFLVPLFVIFTIFKKLWTTMSGVGSKLADLIGVKGAFLGIKAGPLVSSLLILLLLFGFGMLYRVSVVGTFRSWLDGLLLKYIPGYDIYKANIEKKLRNEKVVYDRPVVLIHFNGIAEAGVISDTLSDGRKVIFVADKPGGIDGKTYVVAADKIEPLAIKENELNKLLAQQGIGWASLL